MKKVEVTVRKNILSGNLIDLEGYDTEKSADKFAEILEKRFNESIESYFSDLDIEVDADIKIEVQHHTVGVGGYLTIRCESGEALPEDDDCREEVVCACQSYETALETELQNVNDELLNEDTWAVEEDSDEDDRPTDPEDSDITSGMTAEEYEEMIN